MIASVEDCRRFLVGNSHRTFGVIKMELSLQQMLDFDAVGSFSLDEHLVMFVVSVGCHGGVGLAVKVVMVIMTSNSAPMGVHVLLKTQKCCFLNHGSMLNIKVKQHCILV